MFARPRRREIPVLLALSALGAGTGLLGVLLVTLPALSLPSMVMVARGVRPGRRDAPRHQGQELETHPLNRPGPIIVVTVGGDPVPEVDDTLMRQLHDEHAAALWRYCVHLTGQDRGRAEDVLQETLLRAWRHFSVLDGSEGSVRGWLFTVARNIVIDEWRTRRSRAEFAVAEVPETGDSGDQTDQLLQAWVVAEAVTRLSHDHRAVLLECYYRGLSVAEAARRLGIPEGTVKSRTHYALRALRLALEEMGVGA